MFKLGFHESWLCVVESTQELDKPIMTVQWWPLFRDAREVWEHEIGGEMFSSSFMGEYTMRVCGFNRTFRLAHGGETRTILFEKTPIPCPKVRAGVETRYHNGRWQKYLKSSGWTSA